MATTPARLPGFTYVEMADFTDEQIDRFVGAWFGVDDEQGGVLHLFVTGRTRICK